MNEKQIDLQLGGILEVPGVEYVEIVTTDQDEFKKGDPYIKSTHNISKSFTLPRKSPDGELANLGELRVYASLDSVYEHLSFQLFIILLSQGAKTFLVSFFILFIIYRLVTRHLEKMANHTKSLNPSNLAVPLALTRKANSSIKHTPDELDELAAAINKMQKKIQKELAANKKHLDELQEMTTIAQERNLAKSKFLANINHELRTPLMGIMGYLELAKEFEVNGKRQELRKCLASAECGAMIIHNLIKDFNDMDLIQQGELTINKKEAKIVSILEDAVNLNKVIADRKKIELVFSNQIPNPHLTCSVDTEKIARVINNLLSNAVKFTEHGKIEVKLFFLSEDIENDKSYKIKIEVNDTGCGISQDKLKRIGERFYQVDPYSERSLGGAGLGLSLAKEMIEMLGGTLEIVSKLNQGTRVTVFIPVDIGKGIEQQSAAAKPVAVTVENQVKNKIKILIVDDNTINQELIQMFLDKEQIQHATASNGEEAIKLFQKEKFDLIIMDMQMPVMNGYEATRKIRNLEAQENKRPIPIIAFTAHALGNEEPEILEAGCDKVLKKPAGRRALVDSIKESLKQAA